MYNMCDFKEYPFCDNNCLCCVWFGIVRKNLKQVRNSVEDRIHFNEIFRDKVRVLVEERKKEPSGRNGLEVTSSSLYHLLKGLDPDERVYIDFFVSGKWRFSSEDFDMRSAGECLRFLPDDLICSECKIVSEGQIKRIRANVC